MIKRRYLYVNSKSRQHAKLGLICLMVFMSVFSTSVIQSVDAFNIGLPDIPFFNFNFGKDSPQKDSTSVIDFDTIKNIFPKTNFVDESKDDNLNIELATADSNSRKGKVIDDDTQSPAATSLPFPSKMMNTVYNNENDDKSENNKDFSKIQATLPLIGDYSDSPSTFLTDVKPSPDSALPGQYIVVFKDDDVTVSDFFSMLSSKTDTRGIEILQVYESVLNGLAIRIPNENVMEAIEQLPMVDYTEKDVMAQAFAQTLPSGINMIDGDLNFPKNEKDVGSVDVDFTVLGTGMNLNDH
jgi:subtilisin